MEEVKQIETERGSLGHESKKLEGTMGEKGTVNNCTSCLNGWWCQYFAQVRCQSVYVQLFCCNGKKNAV